MKRVLKRMRSTRFWAVVFILCVLLLPSSLANADPLGRVRAGTPAGSQDWWDPVPPITVSGSYSGTIYGAASGAGDSATGALRAFAQTSHPSNGQAYAYAYVYDEYTLLGLPVGTPVDLEITLAVEGILVSDNTPNYWSKAIVAADLGTYAYGFFLGLSSSAPLYAAVYNGTQIVEQEVTEIYSIIAGEPFGLAYELDVMTMGYATADFDDTALLSFNLPVGATISSVGGFAQTGPVVPVPGACLLALLGFGSAGLGLRRRHREGDLRFWSHPGIPQESLLTTESASVSMDRDG